MGPLSKINPVFSIDAMLGNLATKLRLLGFDSEYSSNIEDDDIINQAKRESRIIVTKDEELSKSAQKQGITVILITKEEELEQLLEINEYVKLGKCIIAGNNARCPKCNSNLELTSKGLIKDKIPEGVFQRVDDFWVCKNCGKIYWEGTHIENLQKFVVELNERLQQTVK